MGSFVANVSRAERMFSMKGSQRVGMYCLVTMLGDAPVSRRQSNHRLTCGCTTKDGRMYLADL